MELFVEGTARVDTAQVDSTPASTVTSIPASTLTSIVEAKPQPIVQSGAFAMIQAAIAQGMNAEQLGKIMDLQDRMEKKAALELFGEAMNAAQREMPVVVRDKKNAHTQSRYASLENVNSTIKPIYIKHGFSLSFGESICTREGYCHVYCDVQHIGGHCKRYEGEFPLDKAGAKGNDNKTAIQATGSTRSYAFRYLELGIFNITVADSDTDGNSSDRAISAKEIEEINGRLDDLREKGQPVDFDKFLKWLGVEDLSKLTVLGFAKAIGELKRKLSVIKAAAEGAAK